MFPEPDQTTNDDKPKETADTPDTTATSDPISFNPAPVTPVASAPEPAVQSSDDSYDSTALSLYIVTVLSGMSVLVSAAYLTWNVLDYFTKPATYSFFDLSSFTTYVLIYLVLFVTLYFLASMRLDARIKKAGRLERPLRTVSSIWRALLVVWGVSALVGLLNSPLTAAIGGGDTSSLVTEIVSAVVGLVFIALLFWRDLFVQKMRSGIIALGVIAGLSLVIAGASAYASFNPKEPETNPYDYSSYDFETEDY